MLLTHCFFVVHADSLPGLGASYGQGSGLILMDAIRCFRNESRLVDCPFNNDTSFDTHVEDAGVQCFSTSDGECVYHHS